MELTDLASRPPAAEPLETSEVSRMQSLTAGDLTISLDARFTPDRVGSPSGTTTLALFGQLQPERMHPGSDYQGDELGTHMVMRRVRLARYRWLLSNISLEPPCVTVAVDRVATAPKAVVPALATGAQGTFWLSTLGVDDLELENRSNPILPVYQDYVEVSLWSYEETTWGPWSAIVRARRVLHGYDNAYWERKLEVGANAHEVASLGDHQIELLEVAWMTTKAPLDLHARFRLTRGATADGMTRSPPPPPFVPFAR